jgi:hypothetical protein
MGSSAYTVRYTLVWQSVCNDSDIEVIQIREQAPHIILQLIVFGLSGVVPAGELLVSSQSGLHL